MECHVDIRQVNGDTECHVDFWRVSVGMECHVEGNTCRMNKQHCIFTEREREGMLGKRD